jgi:hypothetical protein
MEGSKRGKRKNDRIDANKLARLGRVDPQSLHPMRHRSKEVRQDLVVLRARDALVAARTELINATRGLVKSMGARLPKCSSPSFAQKVEEAVPLAIREAAASPVAVCQTQRAGRGDHAFSPTRSASEVWLGPTYSSDRQLSVDDNVILSPRAGCVNCACPVRYAGVWKRGMVGLMRHRQPKGSDSARPYLNCRPTPRLHPTIQFTAQLDSVVGR